MTLYWPADPQDIDLTAPCLHAFIIGVGEYPHLMGGASHPAVVNFGLQQLTTTIITAKRIAKWLATEYKNPAVKLGSIELLLSPAETIQRPDGSQVAIDGATMKNVKDAFKPRWLKQRCDANAGNIAFFYFAGHGISSASQYLLLSDFGDPNGGLWDNVIDFDGTRSGMRSVKADTQIFFVDACRETPIDALVQVNPPSGVKLSDATIFDQVTSSAAYYAAADGLQAYGPANDVTYFAAALLEALEGAGARQKNGQWVVDTFLLGSGLGHVMSLLSSEINQPLTVNPNASGKPAPIHFPAAPSVRASVGCQSAQANAEALIQLQQGATALLSQAGDKRPWTGRLAVGDWQVNMTFQHFPQVQRTEKVVPPVFELEVPV
jgi:caspase domain-containing protein